MKKQIGKQKHSTFHKLSKGSFIAGYVALGLFLIFVILRIAFSIQTRSYDPEHYPEQEVPEIIAQIRKAGNIFGYLGILSILAMGVILIAQSVEAKYYHDLGGALTTKNMQKAFLDILLAVVIAIVLFAISVLAPWPQVEIGESRERMQYETVWWAQIIQSIFEIFAIVILAGTLVTHVALNTVIYSRITYGKKK